MSCSSQGNASCTRSCPANFLYDGENDHAFVVWMLMYERMGWRVCFSIKEEGRVDESLYGKSHE